jgi:cobalt-zinc-cadmium resistance protein CzcA
MLDKLIHFSLKNKLIIGLMVLFITGFGIYSMTQIPIGAVPDITNNQVQVITTSRNLSTADVEQFITAPVELEMANLPGVMEIRSVSKFGLSVVTIVFDEDLGTYLPRQLIAEKIASASEKIPAGFGTPFMGPVTTGLGEIYQYILDTKPGYKDKYSIMELRTLQDWVVKRQLSGIPGVVEVNTWGGKLKQYEVAIIPSRLNSMDLSISDVFQALESNNSVTGGGYIEKNNQSYFIRGEGLLTNMADIEQIVVTNRGGIPVLMRDIAHVQLGTATRFGAITANGEGEKVMGQIMMLKGANANVVMDAVKARVAETQKTLPEGVFINPIAERSELIAKTTFTVTENLVLGFLIVLFVVVILLGSWRSGLVVASVIPLCLFFALSLMYVFGIDANLMSLGAIDFGIIIDGAVIIVEFIAYKLTLSRSLLAALPKAEAAAETEEITAKGASKMMNSAVFGQLIIIIVFLPILSLTGVEGKMFVPMALAFCFALLGAMLLCFTYVPVASALLLKPEKDKPNSFNKRMMRAIENTYRPAITWALGHKKTVLIGAFAMLLFTGILFSRMGGEFVPTLDEGDFVIQPVLKTGTSLSKTIEITTQIEKILATFPEVEQTATRIGAAEVPTDPMSMEESDVIIKLKPKNTWTSATTKDELADAFKAKLVSIPGIDFEFTQLIEMRFNELITGVRADLAIKIFGEDLDVLATKAAQIKKLIENVEGAADISVEKVTGLPQMSVSLNRSALARYGLSADEVNDAIEMAFAGKVAGVVFEGERRFDVVVRNAETERNDIEDLANTYITASSGLKIPINQVAEVSYTKGPAKISRDDTKRRIVIGVNVRNRDLESVVVDIQALVDKNIKLPPGYAIEYGGQFENLQNATKRLMIVVPIALLLIFVLLYFALGTVSEAALVFTAIPLSAVGGVLFLYLRDLPFSISAGVGFIALFGIAVLNGIVLIEEFKDLKHTTAMNTNDRIITGTTQRLRPVLLTAMAAALGFLPMAMSTLAGAEVQRPLATVVIGGLFTATVLTLFVLPVLYSIFENRKYKASPKALLFLGMMVVGGFANAQEVKQLSLEEAIQIALTNNKNLAQNDVQIEQAQIRSDNSFKADKTTIYYNKDANNIAENGAPINVWGVSQQIAFPTVYGKTKQLNEATVTSEKAMKQVSELEVTKGVSMSYNHILTLKEEMRAHHYIDSIYANFSKAAKRRFELGETNQLESLMAESKYQEQHTKLAQTEAMLRSALLELNKWLHTNEAYEITAQKLTKLEWIPRDQNTTPTHHLIKSLDMEAQYKLQLSKQQFLPDLQASYFQGTNNAANAKMYRGVQAGLAIPLFYGAQKAEVNHAKMEIKSVELMEESYLLSYQNKQVTLQEELAVYQAALALYETNTKVLSLAILNTALRSYQEGEINYLTLIQSLEHAKNLELDYIKNLSAYNQTITALQYLN